MAPFIATYAIIVTHDVQLTRKEAEVSHIKFRNIPGGYEETKMSVRQYFQISAQYSNQGPNKHET
jgi:hypothetical protein